LPVKSILAAPGGGYFRTYQLADDFCGCFVGSFGPDMQPCGGNGVQKDKGTAFFPVLCEKTAVPVTGQFWCVFRPVFVKRPRFFFRSAGVSGTVFSRPPGKSPAVHGPGVCG
jgi:hypothetical protein